MIDGIQLAEGLLSYVYSLQIEHIASDTAPCVTISCGVVSRSSLQQDSLDLDTLIRMADKALYAAKQHGRNRNVYEE